MVIKGSSAERQLHYRKKVVLFEANIRDLLKKETLILAECRADPATAAPKLFFLAERMLDIMSNYLMLNGISQAAFNTKDEKALSEAKKSVSKAIIYLENVVTGKIDAPFSDYESSLDELAVVDMVQRYDLARKLGLSISLLKAAYGHNTKWRWVFVDMEGHCAAVTKNLLDLKKARASNDPSAPDYETLLYHVNLTKRMLGEAAERLHSRFTMATKREEDLRRSCQFLMALHRIHMIFNERSEAELVKKKHDVWISALETGGKKPVGTKSP
jgi:hypothetical protein